jgi:hypothetical protein
MSISLRITMEAQLERHDKIEKGQVGTEEKSELYHHFILIPSCVEKLILISLDKKIA